MCVCVCVCVCVRAGGKGWFQGSANTQPPHLCPHGEASPVHGFQGLALLNLAAGKSSLCRPGTQRQSATGKSHPRGVFNELWRHCSCTQGARTAAGPGLTDPAQAFGAKHCLELRQDNTMRVSEGQKKKKKKKSRGRKILEIPCVPAMEEPFLKINSKRKVAARPGRGPQGAGGSCK